MLRQSSLLVSRVAARSLHSSAVSRMAQEAEAAGAEKVVLTLASVSPLFRCRRTWKRDRERGEGWR